MLVVLKLGGSVITEKDRPLTVDENALSRVAGAVARAEVDRLVLVHGGGSFGHPTARDHAITSTTGSHDASGVRAVHDAMKRLDEAVIDVLDEVGVSALPVHPLSAGVRDDEGGLTLFTDQLETMLDEGFVPVLHGDVVAHAGEGATVASGDELVVEAATALGSDRIGLCSTVPGVLDVEGAVIPEVTDFDAVEAVLGGSESTDVTGGMAGKVRALLALDPPAWIFGPDELEPFLLGEAVGTRIGGP